MRPDTADFLDRTPVEALQCRDLRHAWPRAAARPGRRKMVSADGIRWQLLSQRPDGGVKELQRTMACQGGCGVTRTEVFLVRPGGSLERVGAPRYKHPPAYLRRRTEPDTPLEALDPDVLRGRIIMRLYPRLTW